MENVPLTGYQKDILDQPQALHETLQGLAAMPEVAQAGLVDIAAQARAGGFRQIVLTGMGSSLHAFYPFYYRLIEHGFSAMMMETSELLHYGRAALRPDTLVVACSQSGHSVEIVRLLEITPPQTTLVGITNTADSPLARQSAAQVLTRAGIEMNVSCKTYIASLAAMEWLGDLLVTGEVHASQAAMEKLPGLMAAYLADWREHVDWLTGALRGTQNLFLAGRGPSMAAVETGGLTTKESTHFHAEGMSSAALRHGPMEMTGPGTTVALFEGQAATRELNRGMRTDLTRAGVRVLWVGEEDTPAALRLAPVTPRALPLLEILPVQMMTLAMAHLQGRVAGEFERNTKVTVIE